MKTKLLIVVLLSILSPLVFGIVCQIPESVEIPFGHDPNLINYRVVQVVPITLGQTFECDLDSCDEDETNQGFVYTLLAGPVGMTCTPEGHLTYTPVSVDITFGDFEVEDIPLIGSSDVDRGTICFQTILPNKPPVFQGCGK